MWLFLFLVVSTYAVQENRKEKSLVNQNDIGLVKSQFHLLELAEGLNDPSKFDVKSLLKLAKVDPSSVDFILASIDKLLEQNRKSDIKFAKATSKAKTALDSANTAVSTTTTTLGSKKALLIQANTQKNTADQTVNTKTSDLASAVSTEETQRKLLNDEYNTLTKVEKLLTTLLNGGVDIEKACTGGTYKESDGYKFCYGSGRVNFRDAEKWCQDRKLQLVQPTTKEHAFAISKICSNDCTWLDLHCDESFGAHACDTEFDVWEWKSGTPLSTEFNQMRKDPDGTIYGGSPGEYCAHWWHKNNPYSNGVWGPQGCSSTYYGSLCEVGASPAAPITPVVDVKKACTGGTYKSAGGYHFCYGSGGKNYETADKWCKDRKLHLVSPITQAHAYAVSDVCGHDCTWLDLHCKSKTSKCNGDFTLWTWGKTAAKLSDGANQMSLNNDGTIYGGGNTEYCAHWWFKNGGGSTSKWGPQGCTSTYYGALCEAW